ncbi:MAG TPA: hypothetical protein VN625_02205 [Desulfuromonadaceae bacterium]|nr:hypothetical protein [Desulfuromonadaceae bacterium]
MKTLVTFILALGIGFAAAYVIVTKQKNAERSKPHLATREPVQTATPAAEPKVIVKTVTSGSGEESPQDLLNDLISVRPGVTVGERNVLLRTVVFKLESLAHCGTAAVPAIQAFIGKNVDVDYNQPENQDNQQANDGGNNATNNNNGGNRGFNRGNNNNNGAGFGGFGFRGGARRARNLQNLQTDWIVPPSLRLGLVSTLKEIGGSEAERALGDMLRSTGRGVEVAYLTVVLEEMAPGRYRDEAIKSAKELLLNPIVMDRPDRLDDLSKSYLYGVLQFYGDTSFAMNAQQMLVGKDGHLDMDAVDYLSSVLKGQSVSALYAAYNNPSLTNQFEKRRLGRDILNYVGQNAEANQLFAETLNNAELDNRMKVFSIIQLAGGFGGGDNLNDFQLINQRVQYLQSISAQYAGDPTLAKAFDATIKSLQSGDPVEMRDIFGNNGGGGGRRGGNRGGGGDGGAGGGGQ